MLNERTTTDLDKVRERPWLFTWGKVLKIHDVGRYSIAEYDQRRSNSRELTGEVAFHVYVDGKDQCVNTKTLDGALLLAIAVAHLGPNEGGHAARFMARSLKVEMVE